MSEPGSLVAAFEAGAAAANRRPPCQICGPLFTTVVFNGAERRLRVSCDHEEAAYLAEQAERKRNESFTRWQMAFSGILPEPLYRGATLDQVDPTLPGSKAGLAYADRYLETWPERQAGGEGLFLTGDIGTGKTLIASAIASELHRRFNTVAFCTSEQILNGVKGDNAALFRAGCESANLLVIDDFGAEYASEWALSQLFALIHVRYQARRPIIVTTNLNSRALCERYTRALGQRSVSADEARIDVSRLLSRLTERCYAVTFRGPDQRQARKPTWMKEESE